VATKPSKKRSTKVGRFFILKKKSKKNIFFTLTKVDNFSIFTSLTFNTKLENVYD